MLKNSLKLDALAWKAANEGKTYGLFCISLSEKDKEDIYSEYEQLLEKRQQEETERLNRAKEKARVNTKKNVFSYKSPIKQWKAFDRPIETEQ